MSAVVKEERYVFETEWFDQQASLIRNYLLTYYPKDKTIDMYDLKNRRMFLKRMAYPDIDVKDIFVGSIVTVYSRQLKIVDYGDVFTRQQFAQKKQSTFAMIKPDVYAHTGKIIDSIYQNGFIISKLKMSRFNAQTANQFYSKHQSQPFFGELSSFLQSDVCTGMEIVAEGAIDKWRDIIGPTDSVQAKMHASRSLRASYGTNSLRNAVHGSHSAQEKTAEVNQFFGRDMPTTAFFSNCTCCIIKPHIVQQGLVGQIIDIILEEGFEISAMQMFNLDKPTAEEFFEVYKGLLPEFVAMIDNMTTGPCIVMEVRQENAVQKFRELCGPMDPEIAKNLRPNTLRAKFGHSRVLNGVHCTDLPEDGTLECEYFFSIQQEQ